MKEINNILNELNKGNVFLTGAGGTGKSYTTKKIIQRYKLLNREVVILGSTGIAASSIGGQTIHSFFKIGMSSNIDEYNKFLYSTKPKIRFAIQSKLDKIIPEIDLLIIDEISMVSKDLMDLIEYQLDYYQFKGKILVVGDFFQLPPVSRDKDEEYAFESEAWINRLKFKTIELKTLYRTKDKEFINILNNIRLGKVSDNDIDYLEMLRNNKDKVKYNFPTILTGTNKEAKGYNDKKLKDIKAPLHIYDWELYLNIPSKSEDEINIWKKYNNKKVFNFCKGLLTEEKLNVKVGSSVIFISNGDRFYNGEKGVIIEIKESLKYKDETDLNYSKDDKGYVKVLFTIEKQNGELVEIEKHKWDLIEYETNGTDIDRKVIASVYQYPIKLAYGMTIHKSQGLSIDNLICDINKIFTYSQFYVCMSRVINPKNLYLHYSKNNFRSYIKKICNVNDKVVKFYGEIENA